MNVLVLHSELGVLRGGGENFTRNLFTAFAERGHGVAAAFIADRNGKYPIPLPSVIYPIPIRGWWSRNLGQAMLSGITRHVPLNGRLKPVCDRFQGGISWRVVRWHNQRFQLKVEKELLERLKDFDSVYVHGDATLASKVANYRPTILRLPGPVSADFSSLMRKVHAVCANGDAFSRIAQFLGKDVIELPPGLDGQLFKCGATPLRSTLGWSDQEQVIGYVGRLTQIKGVDLLAAAFHELSRTLPDVRLLIVGRGESEGTIRSILTQELESRMAHIEPDIDHERLPQWYRAMDLFVMPSRYENHSNALLEAMACGVPFLASDIGGNKPFIDTGSGWLFERESVSSLSLCLGKILANRVEMKSRGEVGSRYVRGRYSWATSAERLEEIIVSRLGGKR
jgi:glycosyltransferase involved in cell wall biosynthesis